MRGLSWFGCFLFGPWFYKRSYKRSYKRFYKRLWKGFCKRFANSLAKILKRLMLVTLLLWLQGCASLISNVTSGLADDLSSTILNSQDVQIVSSGAVPKIPTSCLRPPGLMAHLVFLPRASGANCWQPSPWTTHLKRVAYRMPSCVVYAIRNSQNLRPG